MIISKNWGLGKTTLCVLPLLLKKFFNLLLELLRLSLLSYSVVPTLLGLENGEAGGVERSASPPEALLICLLIYPLANVSKYSVSWREQRAWGTIGPRRKVGDSRGQESFITLISLRLKQNYTNHMGVFWSGQKIKISTKKKTNISPSRDKHG